MNEINTHPLLDLAVLDRYLADEAVPAERAQVEAWLAANPLHVQRLQVLQTLGESTDITPAETLNVDRAWTQVAREQESFVRGRIRSVTVDRNGSKSKGNQIRWRGAFKAQTLLRWPWYTLAVAAVGIVVLIVGWNRDLLRPRASISASMLTYLTGPGERASITLPDGSTVSLDVASRLNVPADYLAGNHVLYLEGEALFTVRHQLGAPLTVNTGTVQASVLGTSFLVRHYAVDTTTLVAVREGRVAVQTNRAHAMVLTAARQVTIGRGTLREEETEPAAFSFADGVLTLTGGLLTDAIPRLDRWYDVDIQLGDSTLARQRLTGEYAAGSLSDLKDLLELTFNVRVVRTGRVLTLYRRK